MNKPNKKIIHLAEKISKLENLIHDGIEVERNTEKLENVCSNLSLEEMSEIDDYILINKKIKY